MKFSAALLLSFCSVILNVYAQNNLVEGYIVTQKGDTVHGLINNKNWDKNPEKINFKNLNGQVNQYGPTDINLFSVNGDQYESYALLIDYSPVRAEKLGLNGESLRVLDTVFLKTLLKTSSLALYYLKDKAEKQHLFFSKNGDLPQELYQNMFLKEKDGGQVVITQNIYQNQLQSYLSDCKEIQHKIRFLRFSPREIQNLIREYLECKDISTEYSSKNESAKLEAGIFAGANSAYSYLYDNSDNIPSGGLNNGIDVVMGFKLNLVLPRSNNKNNIVNELMYRETRFRHNNFRTANSGVRSSYSYLVVNTAFRYNLLNKQSQFLPYLMFGMSNGLKLQGKNDYKNTSIYYIPPSDTTIYDDPIIKKNEQRKYEYGYFLGIGLEKKKFGFEVRYNRTNSIAVHVATPVNNYQVTVAYRINKS